MEYRDPFTNQVRSNMLRAISVRMQDNEYCARTGCYLSIRFLVALVPCHIFTIPHVILYFPSLPMYSPS